MSISFRKLKLETNPRITATHGNRLASDSSFLFISQPSQGSSQTPHCKSVFVCKFCRGKPQLGPAVIFSLFLNFNRSYSMHSLLYPSTIHPTSPPPRVSDKFAKSEYTIDS